MAGHIVECGAQSTGGNFTDWHDVPRFAEIGYPVLEVHADGSFVVTKHDGTGGAVTVRTVKEQLVYEMGDPRSYITPDVVADFASARLEQAGRDRVRVWGVKGRPAPSSLKISAAYADGWKANGTLIISGPEALSKSKAEVRSPQTARRHGVMFGSLMPWRASMKRTSELWSMRTPCSSTGHCGPSRWRQPSAVGGG